MNKRIFAVFYLVLILSLFFWLFSQATADETMPMGSSLPAIEYKDRSESSILGQSNIPLIIIYFSTLCEHCRYQLSVIETNIDAFNEIKIYLLSSQSDLFKTDFDKKWVNLVQHNNVIFGITPKDSFNKLFGSTVTPSLYFFDSHGILKEKIHGETKASKIIEISKNLMSGRTQSRQ